MLWFQIDERYIFTGHYSGGEVLEATDGSHHGGVQEVENILQE